MNEIAELIKEYGFSYTFLAFCLFLMGKFGLILVKWVELKLLGPKKIDHSESIQNEQIQIDGSINDILFDMQQTFTPDRIMILQYHNGESYLSGCHKKFISATHETTNNGISSGIMTFQNIPASIFQPPNSPLLLGENNILIKDLSEYTSNAYLKQMYDNLGFKSYYAFAIRNKNKTLIGKLTLVGLSRAIRYNNEKILEMEKYVSKIEGLLNYNNAYFGK